MSEERYFMYVREGSYTKASNDRESLYQFKDGKPVKVVDRDDQLRFAGDTNFIEVDSKGDPIDSSKAMPSNNPSSEDGSPLSYVSLAAKGADKKSAPEASEKEAEEDEKEDKKEKKKSKKKSKSKSNKKKSKKKKDEEDEKEDKEEDEDK